MDSPELSLSPTPELPEADHNDATEHPLEDLQDDPTVQAADPDATKDDLSDLESELSDVDEAQFEDFDPNQIAIEERPAVAVDEDNINLIGRHKRKRDDADGERKKKKKEGRREKPRKSKKKKDSDDDFSGAEQLEGKRARKKKPYLEGDGRKERARPEKRQPVEVEDEENLDPEERRKRALDRAMDAVLKAPSKRRTKRGDIDLATAADDEIHALRNKMAAAAEADVAARSAVPPRPAMFKLKMLPEVTAVLNRNGREIENAIVDPENNLLESVRFFLEPLSDGSMPAYNIQRELFAALARLPIDKESLISSGLGKVVFFYTKTKKAEVNIKRAAERLCADWSRPILKRGDDYRKRELETAEYDPLAAPRANANSQVSLKEAAAIARAKALAPQMKSNRARVDVEKKTYTVAPKSNATGGAFARPLGASGEDAFRRIKMRHQALLSAKKR